MSRSFHWKFLYVVSNRNVAAGEERLGPVRFSPLCFDISRMLRVKATGLSLRTRTQRVGNEPDCSLPVPWHTATGSHLVNPLALCGTRRACTQVNACTLTSMQTSVSAICRFTCFGMLLGCFSFHADEPLHVIFVNEMLDTEIYNIIVSEGLF